MNDRTLLNKIISEELEKIEQNGEKVSLSTHRRVRAINLIICVLFAIIFANPQTVFISILFILIGIFRFFMISKVSIIAKLAKKMPDTPIDEIIRGDML